MKLIRAIAGAGFASFLVGCYTLQPIGGVAPQPGNAIGLDINDAGRVALGGAMGPAIEQVEGRLVQQTNSEYVVAVSSIHLLRGGDQIWSGEEVHIRSDYVSSVYARRFSKSRTVALTAAAVGTIALMATKSVIGSSLLDPTQKPDSTVQSILRPRR
ncbi:MAG TPA: hypothetical protein VGF24_15840 [Vicinamibacterales bacterium]|jgi:hypothetical protein